MSYLTKVADALYTPFERAFRVTSPRFRDPERERERMYDLQTAMRNGDPNRTQRKPESEVRRAKRKAQKAARKLSRGSNRGQKRN